MSTWTDQSEMTEAWYFWSTDTLINFTVSVFVSSTRSWYKNTWILKVNWWEYLKLLERMLLIRYELFIMPFVVYLGCAVDVWLRKELRKRTLLHDVKQASTHNTSELESFHSTINILLQSCRGYPMMECLAGLRYMHDCI